MLRSGKEHLELLRDGRVIYVGGEKIDDVTRHPAFRTAAQTVAAIYDMKADPANRGTMSYEEDGGRHSIYFLRAKTRDDLQRRMEGHRRIADLTYGMFGRSPDHVASFVTGMAMKPDVLTRPCGHPENLLAYYRYARDNDVYTVYAVVPPQAARNPEFYQRQNIPVPTLRVVGEDDGGVVISGMKMLATGARLRQRDLDRQRHSARARSEEGGDHLRDTVQCARAGAVVAQADGARRQIGVRFAARLPLRRERQHAAVRQRQGAVGKGVRARRRAAVARHLCQEREPLLRQPPVQCALLVEDAAAARPVRQDRASDRRRPGAGRARDARQDGGDRGHDRRTGARPDQRLRELARGLRLLQPPHHVCGARMVHAELQYVHRRAAHAVRRRRLPDAGRQLGDG